MLIYRKPYFTLDLDVTEMMFLDCVLLEACIHGTKASHSTMKVEYPLSILDGSNSFCVALPIQNQLFLGPYYEMEIYLPNLHPSY
jgi:hypothetical protein